jgi:hypothetical protein
MTGLGFAPTQDMPQLRISKPVTAPAFAIPAEIRPGALVAYHGTSFKDHGNWIFDGACRCGCGGLKLWRKELDGLHRLVHVSLSSVTARFPW